MAPVFSMKNMPMFSLAGDMGLGDQLKNDVQSEIDERRKKVIRDNQTSQMDPMRPISMSMMSGFSL